MLCQECKKRKTCVAPCTSLLRELDNAGEDRLYTDRHIRRKEVPTDPHKMNAVEPPEILRDGDKWTIIDKGKQKNTTNYEESEDI